MTDSLLEVQGLKKYFPIKQGLLKRKSGDVKAVDGLDFFIRQGETFGLVGESGCGKSTTGRLLLRLLEPTEGKVLFEGTDITQLSKEKMRRLRNKMQMIFQDPFASLDPRKTVEKILEEPLIVHGNYSKKERKKKVREMLEVVGMSNYHAKRYPHQFSGGQRQRIGIARALMTRPKLIIADEPVSALDVSVQSQILNLLEELQQEFNLTYLFIAHDLGVVRHISNNVGVMYLGRLVELSTSEKVYEKAYHPYTKALLSSVPVPDPDFKQEEIILQGDIPSPANPPKGCTFHNRCPECMDICKSVKPEFKEIEPGHYVSCHLFNDKKF